MELIVVDRAEDAGDLVAARIEALARREPSCVVGLATGDSPRHVYRCLARRTRAGLNLSRATFFALDEYVGLEAGHPQSYREELHCEVVIPLRLDPAQLHVPAVTGPDLGAAAAAYEQSIIEAGGVDLQLLGIGSNGHLGFNEPGAPLLGETWVAPLAAQTRRDNARFFTDVSSVPTACVTQGLGTIRRARHLVLLAFGHRKAQAIASALEGPVTDAVPASVVQTHPHVTVVLDTAAASQLRHHRRSA